MKRNIIYLNICLLFIINCKHQILPELTIISQQESKKSNERVELTDGYSTHTKYYLNGNVKDFVLIDSLETVVFRIIYNEDGSVNSDNFIGKTWYGFNKDNDLIKFKTIIPPYFDETMTFDYYEQKNYENGLKPEIAYRDSLTKIFTFSFPKKDEEAAFQIVLKNKVDSVVLYQSFKVRGRLSPPLSVE